jgi:Flp pilus assembly protein TadD
MRLSPDAGSLYYLALGFTYFFLNDMDQALINLREAVARNPADLETRVYLAAVYAALGEREAAAWEVDEIRALQPGFSLEQWLASSPLANEAQKTALSTLLAGYRW